MADRNAGLTALRFRSGGCVETHEPGRNSPFAWSKRKLIYLCRRTPANVTVGAARFKQKLTNLNSPETQQCHRFTVRVSPQPTRNTATPAPNSRGSGPSEPAVNRS